VGNSAAFRVSKQVCVETRKRGGEEASLEGGGGGRQRNSSASSRAASLLPRRWGSREETTSVILRWTMEIVYFANTSQPLPRVTLAIIRFGLASFPFTARLVGSSRPPLDRTGREREEKDEGESGGRERRVRKGKGTCAKAKSEGETGGRKKKERHTSNQRKAHLARAADSPSRSCDPSNSRRAVTHREN